MWILCNVVLWRMDFLKRRTMALPQVKDVPAEKWAPVEHRFRFVKDDGGRHGAGFQGTAGDCVTRAIAIATGLRYREVYDELMRRSREYRDTRRTRTARAMKRRGSRGVSPRDGVHKEVYKQYLIDLGWEWTPTMAIGQGCTVHLRVDELPPGGPLIVSVSRHLTVVNNGALYDMHDPTRMGTRCVYGYWRRG